MFLYLFITATWRCHQSCWWCILWWADRSTSS